MKTLMSNKDYHSHEAIGSTLLKKIASKSVLHAISEEAKESPALVMGSAVHASILEPETFKQEFIVSPKFDKRTKQGKEDFAAFENEAQGKTIIDEITMQTVTAIKNSVLNHPLAGAMLRGGEAEYSYFTKDESTDLELKCRPDYVNQGALIDLKTCQDASAEGFMRACVNFGYHIQAAFYLDVYNAANGTDISEFFFVAVETKAPFAVNTFKMGEVEINLGREQYKKALKAYKQYLEAKDSQEPAAFGYSPDIKMIEFPVWALMKNEVA